MQRNIPGKFYEFWHIGVKDVADDRHTEGQTHARITRSLKLSKSKTNILHIHEGKTNNKKHDMMIHADEAGRHIDTANH